VTYQSSVCAIEAACRRICAGTLNFDLVRLDTNLAVFPDTDLRTLSLRTTGTPGARFRYPGIEVLSCCRRSRHDRLAPSLLYLLDGRLGELVGMNGDGRLELAGTENLD